MLISYPSPPHLGQIRSAYESNVVCSFDTQEAIFDYAFDRLSITGGQASCACFAIDFCGASFGSVAW